MNFLKTIGLIIGVPIAFLVLAVCYYRVFHSYTYRYRITVEVEVDGKVHSGSGLFETRHQYNPGWLPRSSVWGSTTTGEVPIVDLGKPRHLDCNMVPKNSL